MSTKTRAPKVRARTPWLTLAGILFLVGSIAGGACANLIPVHIPTVRERQRVEQTEWVVARREKIAAMTAQGDRCDRAVARELAKTLVFDGQSASAYADDFEHRCGTDVVVRRWATRGDRLLASQSVAAARAISDRFSRGSRAPR